MSWLSDLFGGKKSEFQTYTPPDYTKLKDLLYGYQEKGFPEIMSEQYWGEPWRKTSQDIRELYEGKRGMGAGSTPEVAQLGYSRAGLMSDLIGQNVGVRQGALNALTNITPRPETQYIAEQPNMLQNLLSLGAPLASVGLSSYLNRTDPTQQAIGDYFRSKIAPKSPADVYDYEQEPDFMQYADLASNFAKMIPSPYAQIPAYMYDFGKNFF